MSSFLKSALFHLLLNTNWETCNFHFLNSAVSLNWELKHDLFLFLDNIFILFFFFDPHFTRHLYSLQEEKLILEKKSQVQLKQAVSESSHHPRVSVEIFLMCFSLHLRLIHQNPQRSVRRIYLNIINLENWQNSIITLFPTWISPSTTTQTMSDNGVNIVITQFLHILMLSNSLFVNWWETILHFLTHWNLLLNLQPYWKKSGPVGIRKEHQASMFTKF